jgi:hypothetical protein
MAPLTNGQQKATSLDGRGKRANTGRSESLGGGGLDRLELSPWHSKNQPMLTKNQNVVNNELVLDGSATAHFIQ